MKVFLGGTCNGSNWREELIKELDIDYFNPVIENWDDKAQVNEYKEKNEADFLLFVITPLMVGVYSIAEVVDASNKKPEKTILCILDSDAEKTWTEHQRNSLRAVEDLVKKNGAIYSNNLEEVATILNNY